MVNSGLLNVVKNSRFEDLVANNPYNENPRRKTWWDSFVERIGLRSAYEKSQENLAISRNEWNSQLATLASEEQYNSPIEQARRLREAGQNPDITGGLSSELASEFDQEQTSPDIQSSSSDLMQAFSSIMDVVGIARSIAGDFFSLRSLSQQIESGNIDNVRKYIDLVRDSDSLFEHFGSGDTVQGWNNDPFIRSLFRNKSQYKRFLSVHSAYQDSLMQSIQHKRNSLEHDRIREDLANLHAKPTYSYDDFEMESLLRPMAEAVYDVTMDDINRRKHQNKRDIAQADYQADVTQQLDSGLEAGDINQAHSLNQRANQYQIQQIDSQKIASKMYFEMIENLSKKADEGHLGAQIAIGILGMKLQGILPQISLPLMSF